MRTKRLVALLAAMSLFALALPASATTVLADGLAGPLGLATDSQGTVYVTEAFGTGRLISISRDGVQTVLVEEPGTELAGVDVGRSGVVYTQTTFDEEGLPVDATLNLVTSSGPQVIASTLAYEAKRNPDASQSYGFLEGASDECLAQFADVIGEPSQYTGIIDSHPYAVAAMGSTYYVADAAGNSLLAVSGGGRISTVAVFPAVPQVVDEAAAEEFGIPACTGETYFGEPVPTDVEVGPGGYLYVSLLPGAPEIPGTGQIWKVNPKNGSMTKVADGLTSSVDIAVAPNGTIYVAELFPGLISTVRAGGSRVFAELASPGAIEIGRDGTLYATSDVFGNGSVVMLDS